MAKRKQQNVQIERQLKQRKNLYRGIGLLVVAVIAMAIGAGIWAYRDRQTVLRYDGGRVATTDFRASFEWNFQNNPGAREAALDWVKSSVVLRDRAITHNADLTAEERDEAIQTIANWRQEERDMRNGFDAMGYISNERMAELFMTGPIFGRLMDIYVPTYDVNEDELAELVEEHIEENFHYGMDLQVRFIDLASLEEIEEAESMLGTMHFDDIVRQFSDWLEDDDEMPPTSSLIGLMPTLQELGISGEAQEFLLNMEEGEYSHIIELMNFEIGAPIYVLFKMESVSEADMDEVTDTVSENLIQTRRNEIFFELIEDWIEEANFVVNPRGYNSI